MIVAHRGASVDAPENTLPAFELAWAQDADAIEGDFHLTKDKKIVCIHDTDTLRTAGIKYAVKETLFKELQKLDVGQWKHNQWQGTRIPTIAEVFATIPAGKKIFIEIKVGLEMLAPLWKAIKKSKLHDDQIVIISFSPEVIRAAKEQAPHFTANWLSVIKKDESGAMHPSVEQVLGVLKRTGADGVSSSKNLINQAYIQSILDAGYGYHVWTVNDKKTAEKLKKWGIQSITTDNPGLIKPINN